MNVLKSVKNSISSYFRPQKPHRVAVLMPADYPLTEEIYDGFARELTKNSTATVIINTFKASKAKSVTEHLQKIVQDNYDIIFSIGGSCTKAAAAYTSSIGSSIPIVCSNITPSLLPINSLPSNVTGNTSEEGSRIGDLIERLFLLRKKMHHLLFIHDFQNPFTVYERTIVDSKLDALHCSFSSFNSRGFDIKNFESFIEKSFPKIDAILFSRDITTLSVLSKIIEYGNNQSVAVISCDPQSVMRGASLGFCPAKPLSGYDAARKALLILEKHVAPAEIPFSIPKLSYRIQVNGSTMYQQNLNLKDDAVLALKYMEIM